MALQNNNKCIKMRLPNGEVVDILTPVTAEIEKWLQVDDSAEEAGGYIVGYQHEKTGNVSLEAVTHPYPLDIRSRTRFIIRDPRHNSSLKRFQRNQSYYMGVWHTHPQLVPTPSEIDWEDWNATIHNDTTGSKYCFFIIAGISEWKLWIGDMSTGEIIEANECDKNSYGLYERFSER